MRRHLHEAARSLDSRIETLVRLDEDAVCLLPSAFCCDVRGADQVECQWPTEVFSNEILQLRQQLIKWSSGTAGPATDDAVEFRTLDAWFVHFMSVWHVLDRYGTNLLHYKTIREVEIAKDLDDIAKDVVARHVTGEEGLGDQGRRLLDEFAARLADEEAVDIVDSTFRAELEALRESTLAKMQEAFADLSAACRAKSANVVAMKAELEAKLTQSCSYQCELLLYTWQIQVLVPACLRDHHHYYNRKKREENNIFSELCRSLHRVELAFHETTTPPSPGCL